VEEDACRSGCPAGSVIWAIGWEGFVAILGAASGREHGRGGFIGAVRLLLRWRVAARRKCS